MSSDETVSYILQDIKNDKISPKTWPDLQLDQLLEGFKDNVIDFDKWL